ncbi:hypothetical protein NEOC95_002233 [Neochlamydia sp. AcF95]|nr:hypothetical protein [Neochlamydia sp. AcF95]
MINRKLVYHEGHPHKQLLHSLAALVSLEEREMDKS